LSQLELNAVVLLHVDVGSLRRDIIRRCASLRVERGVMNNGAFDVLTSFTQRAVLMKGLNFRGLLMLLSLRGSVDLHRRSKLVALLFHIKQRELVKLCNLLLAGGSERLHVLVSVLWTQIFRAGCFLVSGEGLLAGTIILISVQDLVEALPDLLQRITEAT
jgi:hypothetical protein